MNILNYEKIEIKDIDEIFEKQREIMFAFEPSLKQRVEEFDIDIFEDQMLLKDFLLTRMVEELTEASIALRQDHFEHYKEELVDAFNFLVEAAIILGYVESDYLSEKEEKYFNSLSTIEPYSTKKYSREAIYDVVEAIGEFTNKLKLRPWRDSQYPVDMLSFTKCYNTIWNKFYTLLEISGISWEEFKNTWSKKYQVNKFRIESNY